MMNSLLYKVTGVHQGFYTKEVHKWKNKQMAYD